MKTSMTVPTALLAIVVVFAGCTGECRSTDLTGDVIVADMAYREGPDAMSLEYTVVNGLDEDIYVVDSLMKIHYDGGASTFGAEMRLGVPEVISIFHYQYCYREIPAGCACEVRRHTLRDYWSLSEDMPVHSVDIVELDAAWSTSPFEPPPTACTIPTFNDWAASIEEGAIHAAHARADEEMIPLDELPDETDSTMCLTVYL